MIHAARPEFWRVLPPLIAAAGVVCCAGSSAAQGTVAAAGPAGVDPAPVIVDDHDCNLEFTFTPGVWVPRLGGTAKLGPSAAAGDLTFEDDFNLDSSEATFAGDAAVRINDAWEVNLGGFAFSTSTDGDTFDGSTTAFGDVTLNSGDTFQSSIDIDSVAGDVAWWFSNPIHTHQPDGTLPKTDLRFGANLGARYVSVDQKLTIAGEGSASGSGDWIAPTVGLQFQMRTHLSGSSPLLKALQVDGGASVGPAFGGDDVGAVIQVHALITAMITNNLGLSFGYRYLWMDLKSDNYELSGDLAGLFLGASVRF